MIARHEKGGVAAPPATARSETSGQVGRYHAPAEPRKAVPFTIAGQVFELHGKRAAFQCAMIVAGDEGVAHIEVMPWLLDPRSAVRALKDRGIAIETRRGKPTRWVLRSPVREVLP
jgi:hypothetical protein